MLQLSSQITHLSRCGTALEEKTAPRAPRGRSPLSEHGPRAELSRGLLHWWVLPRRYGRHSARHGLSGCRPWRRCSGEGLVYRIEDPTHLYLVRQMSDYGIHKPLRGSNSGVRAEISTYPACLLAILLSLARQAQREKETHQFILVQAMLGCNTLLQHFGGLPRRAEDELVQWMNWPQEVRSS